MDDVCLVLKEASPGDTYTEYLGKEHCRRQQGLMGWPERGMHWFWPVPAG